jgi:glycerol-3-phosphate dehydrogenase
MKEFSIENRQKAIDELKSKKFDIVIIGGGITGAGILLDAQLRGLSCCIIEMQDFSEGTSSRSTKLIHGGLRYLKQFKFKLVRETGKERNVVAFIARHLTHPKKVVLPITKDGGFSKFQLKMALWMYDRLANVPKSLRHRKLSKASLLKLFPNLSTANLLGGMEYTEYQTNDARLTIEVIKKGVEHGGIAISRMKSEELLVDSNGKASGIIAHDILGDHRIEIQGTVVINATGPWSDRLFTGVGKTEGLKLIPTKGIHIVFDSIRFPLAHAMYFDTPDNRMIFAIPEDGMVYVGTTDTFYMGEIESPDLTLQDVKYLIQACNVRFPDLNLEQHDLKGAWSGIRPLIAQESKKPSEISRKFEIFEAETGLLTIAGGKLTGYRKMAEKIVNLAIDNSFEEMKLADCSTDTCKLDGSQYRSTKEYHKSLSDFVSKAIATTKWTIDEADWIFNHFGDQSFEILVVQVEVENNLPYYLHQTLLFSLAVEIVLTPLDFLTRRTNLIHFHLEIAVKYYADIAEIVARVNKLPKDFMDAEEARFVALVGEIEEMRGLQK